MEYLQIANPIDYKVALYIRLSKEDDKEGESESVSNQRSMLRRFAEGQKLDVVDEYIDDGISGTTFNRPSFLRMIKDIELKKINMVITKDLSRLGRDYIETGHYIEKYFPENNVRYISILDNVDTGIDSSSNDITPFKSILNDMYAKDISTKIKSVKRNKQDLGLFIGWKPPFGYKSSEDSINKLVIDEDAKDVIVRIFNEAKSGKSCRAIAQDLTLDRILTPSQYAISKGKAVPNVSKHWSDTRIREILLNEVYIGNMVQGRVRKISYKSKKTIKLPKDQWKVIENTHEPIIDKITFYKVREMINSRKQTRIKSHDYLLKGLIQCHECGKKFGCSPKNLAEGRVYYFRCSTYTSYARLRLCTSHNMRMDIVENTVISKIKSIIDKYSKITKLPKITKQELEEKKKELNYTNKLEDLNRKLEKISDEIDKVYNDKLLGILSPEDFVRIYEKKKKQKEEVLNKIDQTKVYIKDKVLNEEEIIKQIVDKYQNMETINREILVSLVDRVEVDQDKKVYIYFKFKSLE